MPLILDGQKVASSLILELTEKIKLRKETIKPKLVFILVGDHPASLTYVGMKERRCLQVGMESEIIRFDQHAKEEELLKKITSLNRDPSVHGILVQMPLPPQMDPLHVMEAIDPSKDVDGFHPMNMGYLAIGSDKGLSPCTPAGIIHLLAHYNIQTTGKHAVVIGRSNIVGKPLALMLVQKAKQGNATVTIAHAHTQNLAELCKTADILIAAAGYKYLVTPQFIKEKAVVIDVGIHKEIGPDGKPFLCGDVDFQKVAPHTSAITPVPGGVGPLTIALLLENTWKSYLRHM